ncbi:glutathione S-transferase family protein [Agaribacterium haliotis]|uniref:glutathione S-transferase family protein n=1 Tax=Agaribacterium haliotis TaxID=2013869 RepID=UPI000BB53408|nr:glutathione S-transferase family protein [Agaribacterium haliotis]
MKLVIGNKNYSSWSLRPWLLLHAHALDFEEVNESLAQHGIRERLSQYSDSAKVPVLLDRGLTIWDSLAICEYISENYLSGRGWPKSAADRAQARSLVAEMHSGFAALRSELPMNCRLTKSAQLSPAVRAEVQRIEQLWNNYVSADQSEQLRLFGCFGIADCFFAPVVFRFHSYGVKLSGTAGRYQQSLLAHPSMQLWLTQAIGETEHLAHIEV